MDLIDMLYSTYRKSHTPYARRVEYAGTGRHHAKLSRRPLARLASLCRDLGDALVGAFMPVTA